jgi:hypothetical protein
MSWWNPLFCLHRSHYRRVPNEGGTYRIARALWKLHRASLPLVGLFCFQSGSLETVQAAEAVKVPKFLSGPPLTTSGDVKLTWAASPTLGITHYELGQRRAGGKETTSNEGPVLGATLRVVEDGEWQFVVRGASRPSAAGGRLR